MSDRPATDAEVRAMKTSNKSERWTTEERQRKVSSLIARIEADGERMREMERAIQRVGREAVVHTHPVGNGVTFEGHLVPNGAMMQLLAVLKEAPDA